MKTDDPRWFGLYGIVGADEAPTPEERQRRTLALADALLGAGVGVLQLRDKVSDGRELVRTARLLVTRAHTKGALFLVNDRLDVALIAGADGVHLGQDDLPVEEVAVVLRALGRDREKLIVGLSTHDLDEVRTGVEQRADYLGFGPIFPTATKASGRAPRGPSRLAEAVRMAGAVPVIAIGGIGLANVAAVAGAGAKMAAVISDVSGAADPLARAQAIQARFESAAACARPRPGG